MNWENQGTPIARVVRPSDENNKKKNNNGKILSVDSDPDSVMESQKEIKLPKGLRFQAIPNFESARTIPLICGPSGVGKSYYTVQWIKEYRKLYPKRPIYLFSSLTSDPTIDKIKGLKRIKLDNDFMQCQFDVSDFKDMAVIFDDCDCMRNKVIKAKVTGLLDMLLETGRHSGTSVCITAHIATRGPESKRSLNEAHSLTVFPASMGGNSCKYLLEGYFGLDKHQIKKLKRLPSRWVTIFKTCPMVILYETGAYVLNVDDD